MPTYEYECQACGKAFDIFQKMTDSPLRKCPSCGKLKLKKKLGIGAGIIFKGSGFYCTDYKKKTGGESSSSTSSSSSSSATSSSESKTSENKTK